MYWKFVASKTARLSTKSNLSRLGNFHFHIERKLHEIDVLTLTLQKQTSKSRFKIEFDKKNKVFSRFVNSGNEQVNGEQSKQSCTKRRWCVQSVLPPFTTKWHFSNSKLLKLVKIVRNYVKIKVSTNIRMFKIVDYKLLQHLCCNILNPILFLNGIL